MDLDGRLEALTQTVELLASFHKDNEKRMERLMAAMEGLVKNGRKIGQETRPAGRFCY